MPYFIPAMSMALSTVVPYTDSSVAWASQMICSPQRCGIVGCSPAAGGNR